MARRIVPHVFLWGVTLLAFQWRFLDREQSIDPDVAVYLAMASFPPPEGILHTTFDQKPPGVLLLMRACVVLFGPYPYLFVKVLYLLGALSSALVLARLAAAMGGGASPALVGWLFILGISAPPILLSPVADQPMAFFQLLSAALLWKSFSEASGGRRSRAGAAALGGCAAAAATFFKFQGVLFYVAGAVLLWRIRPRGLLAAWTAGFAVFWGAAFLALLLAGAWGHFWEWGVLHGLSYASIGTRGEVWGAASYGLLRMGFCWLALWVASVLSILRLRREKAAPADRFLLVWAGLVTFALPLGMYPFIPRYFLPLLAPLCLLAVLRLAEVPPRVRFAFLGVAASLAVVYHVIHRHGNVVGNKILEENVRVGRYIRERTGPLERILVLVRERSGIYLQAGRPPGSRFPDWYTAGFSLVGHPLRKWGYREAVPVEVEGDLKLWDPRFLVDAAGGREFEWLGNNMPDFASRYRRDVEIGRLWLYRRVVTPEELDR